MESTRKWTSPIVYVFLAGLLIGAAVEAAFQPNHIKFIVLSSGQVFLYPQKNDIVEWVAEGPNPKALPKVNAKFDYDGYSPCKEGSNTTRCTINGNPGLYFYLCKDASNNKICDPGIDPNSSTDGQSFYILKLLKKNLESTFKTILSITPKPELAESVAWPLGYVTEATAGTLAGTTGTGTPIQMSNPANLSINCAANGQAEVIVPDYDAKDYPIVQTGWKIQWNSGPYGFDISMPHGACVGDPTINSAPGGVSSCILAATTDVSYTVTTTTAHSGTQKTCSNPNGLPTSLIVKNPAP
jgi:hypothetical protein